MFTKKMSCPHLPHGLPNCHSRSTARKWARRTTCSGSGDLTPNRPCEPARTPSKSNPQMTGKLLLQRGFEFGIGVGLEGKPIQCGIQPLSIRRAKPEFDRQSPLADVGMLLQAKTLMQFDLRLGRIRPAILVTRRLGIKQFQFPAIGP